MKKKAPVGPAEPGKKAYHTRLGRTVEHNSKAELEKRRHVHLTYQKLNGRTVKRKVTPYALKGNVLVGFDHKRKETRSYRMERVKHMEKAASTVVNALRQVAKTPAGRGAILGGITGGVSNAAQAPSGHTLSRGMTGAAAGAVGGAAASHVLHKLSSDFWSGFRKEAVSKELAQRAAQVAQKKIGVHALNAAFSTSNKAHSLLNRKAEQLKKFEQYAQKKASAFAHSAELAGLGILARPAVHEMTTGKELSQKSKNIHEAVGLGVLAAPSLHAAATGAYQGLKKFRQAVHA